MSGIDLDAIRERVNRAAPLPWHVFTDPDDDGVPERAMGVVAPTRPWGDDDGRVVFEDHDTVRADAEFIAAAREDVPALLAEVDRLRAIVAEIRALHTDSPAGFCPSCGRVGDVSDTDDGFVEYPCPTIRALNGEVPRG